MKETPELPGEPPGSPKPPRPAAKEPPFIRTDVQAVELLTHREHLFVEYLTLMDAWEEIDRKIYLVTCEIEGINKAFRQALDKGGLSANVITSIKNALSQKEEGE